MLNRSSQVVTVIIVSLLFTSFFAISSFYSVILLPNNEFNVEDDDRFDLEMKENPDLSYKIEEKSKIDEISSGVKNRILWYKTFEERDLAVHKIPSDLISYVYNNIPAISTKQIDAKSIPLDGIRQVIDDRKIFYHSSVGQQKSLGKIERKGFSLEETAIEIGADKLHASGYTGKGITIAILDSGVEGDLQSFIDDSGISRVEEIWVSELDNLKNSDQDPHGTHVAGIAAGNGRYYDGNNWDLYDSPGIAPQASILSIRVLDQEGFGPTSSIVEGIDRAIDNNVDIISLSLSSELYEGENDIHIEFIKEAMKKGIIVVAAAGNLGPYGSGMGIPAGLDNVLAVGATNMYDHSIWINTAVGPKTNGYPGPEIVAPGVEIVSIGKNGKPSLLTGTSMATPHVAGGIALLMQAFPNATNSQILEAIIGGANNILFQPVEAQGRGLVNFFNAYQILNKTVYDPNSLEMVSAPRLINDLNYHYRNRISGFTKTFPIFLHSSRNITIEPKIDVNKTHGVIFDLPASVNIVEGLNTLNINITVTSNNIEWNEGVIYFLDNQTKNILNNANITYSSITTFPQSKIIFDSAHDNDTASAYFGNHGPNGQFSKFSSLLEDEGHMIYEHQNGELNSSILKDFDLLIIANPDIKYSNTELNAIKKFTQTDGKSMLLIAGGGTILAEEFSYDQFDKTTLNQLLEGTGIRIKGENSTLNCDIKGNELRRQFCFETAKIINSQEIISERFEFPNLGPELDINSLDNQDTNIIAKLDGKPVIISSELSSKGRILVFSSPLIFDNYGIIYNYGFEGSATDNRNIVKNSFDWLIEPRAIQPNYSINGKEVKGSITINMHETITIKFAPKTPDGSFIPLGNQVNVSYRSVNFNNQYDYNVFPFIIVSDGVYQFTRVFEEFLILDLFISIQDPLNELIQSNGHLTIHIELRNFDDQGTFRSISFYLFIAIFLSWILWIINEGGRQKKLQEEKKLKQN